MRGCCRWEISDGAGEFGERGGEAVLGIDVDTEFVVAVGFQNSAMASDQRFQAAVS